MHVHLQFKCDYIVFSVSCGESKHWFMLKKIFPEMKILMLKYEFGELRRKQGSEIDLNFKLGLHDASLFE